MSKLAFPRDVSPELVDQWVRVTLGQDSLGPRSPQAAMVGDARKPTTRCK
jgi:hypothetical protein